jgi:hypothetical protein
MSGEGRSPDWWAWGGNCGNRDVVAFWLFAWTVRNREERKGNHNLAVIFNMAFTEWKREHNGEDPKIRCEDPPKSGTCENTCFSLFYDAEKYCRQTCKPRTKITRCFWTAYAALQDCMRICLIPFSNGKPDDLDGGEKAFNKKFGTGKDRPCGEEQDHRK